MIDVPIIHHRFDSESKHDEAVAARWAWEWLNHLANIYCSYFCIKCVLKIRVPLFYNEYLEWDKAQTKLHLAFSYLRGFYIPDYDEDIDSCPACSLVKAFSTFPDIAHYTPSYLIPSNISIKRQYLDLLEDYSKIHEMIATDLSIPCSRIKVVIENSYSLIKERSRLDTLLSLDLDQVSTITDKNETNIIRIFTEGQAVARKLYSLIQFDPKLYFSQKAFLPITDRKNIYQSSIDETSQAERDKVLDHDSVDQSKRSTSATYPSETQSDQPSNTESTSQESDSINAPPDKCYGVILEDGIRIIKPGTKALDITLEGRFVKILATAHASAEGMAKTDEENKKKKQESYYLIITHDLIRQALTNPDRKTQANKADISHLRNSIVFSDGSKLISLYDDELKGWKTSIPFRMHTPSDQILYKALPLTEGEKRDFESQE